jgi:hypothetical protein
MKTTTFYLTSFLLFFSIVSYAQDNEQNAKEVVIQLSERILIPAEKKDSLINVFKSYFDDVKIYRGKGAKMMHALDIARDREVGRILQNESQFKEYQEFIHHMALQALRNKKSKQFGHHQ